MLDDCGKYNSPGDDTTGLVSSGHIQFGLISLAPGECDISLRDECESSRIFYAIYNIYELTDDTRHVFCAD